MIPELLISAKLVLPGNWPDGRALQVTNVANRGRYRTNFENILGFSMESESSMNERKDESLLYTPRL